MSKEVYVGIVKFTLQSMLDLSKEDKEYNLQIDTIHYYESTIKKENVITMDEFLDLCREVGILTKDRKEINMTIKEKQEFKEIIINKVLSRAKEYNQKYIDEETLRKICFASMLKGYEREEQEQGAKVLCEIKLCAKEYVGGFPIDENILRDICDTVRNNKNI